MRTAVAERVIAQASQMTGEWAEFIVRINGGKRMGFRRTGPNSNSIAGRLAGFFNANPDEELTYPDIMAKCDCTRSAAYMAVRSLKNSKLVEVDTIVRPRKGAP